MKTPYTLITGASGGIGEAIARAFAKRQHNLILAARNTDKLALLSEELQSKFKIDVHYFSIDLSLPDGAQQLYEQINSRGFEVDELVNNAGIGSGGEFGSRELKAETNLIQLNIASLASLTQLFGNDMKRRRRGSVINIASVVAFTPMPYMALYAASKAFVKSFSEAIAEEFLSYGVHVMVFCPGLTKTNFNAAAGLENEKGKGLSLDYSHAKAILQTPEEVAKALLEALEKKKRVAVSGFKNRVGAAMFSFLPNRWIARMVRKRYQKAMNKD